VSARDRGRHPAGRSRTHIALWETDEVDWLEHVTDSEYGGARRSTRA
jgi:hypothetical protein